MTDAAAIRFACAQCEVAWSVIGAVDEAARVCWACGRQGVASSVLLAEVVVGPERSSHWLTWAVQTGQIG